MLEEMKEALDAITPSAEKFPAGKTIVAIRLDRDESLSGKFMTAITRSWQPSGVAVALSGGHVIAANYVFGRWSAGTPKVGACHAVRCKKCGKVTLMPLAVWQAKDQARRKGVKDNLDEMNGWDILRRYGTCSCGGAWDEDAEQEKQDLTAFAGEVLKAIERAEKIGKFLPPTFFHVGRPEQQVDLGPDWGWLKDAMAASGHSAVPFTQNGTGDVVMYNPGQWMGWTDDFDASGLFFLENGRDRKGRGRGFNPCDVNGL